MIHLILLWSSISIQMMDHSASASEINRGTWYGNPWLYLVGLLMIILLCVIKIVFGTHIAKPKAKAGAIKPLPAPDTTRLFSIYYREPTSKSIQFRGKIIERRRKERGSNFRDLLGKVRRDYSYRVIDPSGMFIQASNYGKDKK